MQTRLLKDLHWASLPQATLHNGWEKGKKQKAAAKVKNAHESKKQTQARLLAPEEKKKKGEADCER